MAIQMKADFAWLRLLHCTKSWIFEIPVGENFKLLTAKTLKKIVLNLWLLYFIPKNLHFDYVCATF